MHIEMKFYTSTNVWFSRFSKRMFMNIKFHSLENILLNFHSKLSRSYTADSNHLHFTISDLSRYDRDSQKWLQNEFKAMHAAPVLYGGLIYLDKSSMLKRESRVSWANENIFSSSLWSSGCKFVWIIWALVEIAARGWLNSKEYAWKCWCW